MLTFETNGMPLLNHYELPHLLLTHMCAGIWGEMLPHQLEHTGDHTADIDMRSATFMILRRCHDAGTPVDPEKGMRFVRRIPVFQNGINTDDDWVLFVNPNLSFDRSP